MYLLSFNEDAEEAPHLIMPAAGALPLAVGVSVLLGGLARVVTKFKATPDELSLCRFFTLEFLDLSCDILAYVFCFVEGDLEFADDGGLISISLLASVVAWSFPCGSHLPDDSASGVHCCHAYTWQVRTSCRGIISYTSYSRTNDCIYNGYVNINLEPNAMNYIDTVAHMNMHYTQY